jgi:hypothetical protein
MPRKLLRYSLTALCAAAFLSAVASSAAQAQKGNPNIKPGTVITLKPTDRSNFIGRNDGYVQQSRTVKSGGLYGVGDLAQRSYTKKGSQPAGHAIYIDGYYPGNASARDGAQLATKKGSKPAGVRTTPAVQLNRYAN